MENRKIHVKELVVFLIILLLAKCGIATVYNEGWFSHPEYIKYIWEGRTLDKITADELGFLLDKKTDDTVYVIYTGRKSCPVCVALLPDIKKYISEGMQIAEGRKIKAGYFDSEKYDSEKTEIIRERLGIKTVPSIVVLSGTTVEVFNAEAMQKSDFQDIFNKSIMRERGE